MAAKKTKKPLLSSSVKLFFIILLVPVSITTYVFAYLLWDELQQIPLIEQIVHEREVAKIQQNFDMPIPEQYIPIYMSAGEAYNVPWTLLAAHHRIETRFSTMKKLESPVGAEGHMQVRP